MGEPRRGPPPWGNQRRTCKTIQMGKPCLQIDCSIPRGNRRTTERRFPMTHRRMKIAVTHHTTLDRVRRGSERFVDQLACFMTARGHELTVLTCRPGPSDIVRDRGFTTVYHRSWWCPALATVGVHEHHTFLP